MTTLAQRNLSGGEICPALYSRVDTSKYQNGLRTLRNFLIMRHGGVTNRPGTRFIGEVKNSAKFTRLIPFVFNSDQTYMLEFSDLAMRVIHQGGYVTDHTSTITSITRTSIANVTSAAHGFSNGDEVTFTGILGMIELNDRNFHVVNATANAFQLQNLDGTNLDTSTYGSYTSGGTAARIYTLLTPYLEADLSTLQYVQSADVITIAHTLYPPSDLSRLAHNSWTLTTITFAPKIATPLGISTDGPSGTDTQWVVTTVASGTFEESLPSSAAGVAQPVAAPNGICSSQSVNGIGGGVQSLVINGTLTSGGSYTDPAHGGRNVTVLSNNDDHTRKFTISGTDTDGNPLSEVLDGPNHGTTTGALFFHTVSSVVVDDSCTGSISVGVSTAQFFPVTISWSAVPGALQYRVYKSTNGVFGYIGVSTGTSFKDSNVLSDASITPPIPRNPFDVPGNYPATVTYFQQRLCFGDTINDPEKIWTSRSSNFHNFTTSLPTQDDDAVTFSLVGKQVNEIRHLVELGNFIVFTAAGEWEIQGDADGILKPTAIGPKQHSYNGSNTLPPIVMSGSAVYVQGRGGIVRDLAFDFQIDGYRGNDLSIFSAHLFDGHTITDWCYQQIPHSIVWAVRDDGVLLGLTYVKEQQIIGWHRHDFDGATVESVAAIPEGQEDILYLILKRTINGVSKRYVERMNTRLVTNVIDGLFADCSLSYDGRNTNSAISMTLSGGTTWDYTETLTLTKTSDAPTAFLSSDVGSEIHLVGAEGDLLRCEITAFSSATIVSVKANRTVPLSMRAIAISSWSKAVSKLSGLFHLEGQAISVLADGFVVSNPNNPSYAMIHVSKGSVTLDKAYSVIHIGLPITADIETLNIDTVNGESIVDKRNIITKLTVYTQDSRGIWAGPVAPTDGGVTDLQELKARNNESYDEPVALSTGSVELILRPEWNSNGRVFIRQTDPLPLSVLGIAPTGVFPFKGPTGAGSK